MKLLIPFNVIVVLAALVHWFYRPNFIPVKVDECLQKLRESLNQTMRNVVYDDNRNIGRLSEKLYILGLNVDKGFENFALDYIGYMTIKEIRTYTAGFVKLIEEQRERLKNVYDPRNITQENRNLFETLYTTIEITLHGELGPFRTVINKKPNAKHCWDYGKSVICKIITGISTEIDRILQLEARVNQHKFEKLLKSVGDMREILPAAYEKCLVRRLEDRPEERKKCAAFHMKEKSRLFSFQISNVLIQIRDYFHERNKGASMKVIEYFEKNLPEWKSYFDEHVLKCVESYTK